jgi:signal transduction histidine kinase/CheY-like chemotaxis protein
LARGLESESVRLAALGRYAVVDAEREPIFDRISALATLIYGVSAAAILLVDADRIRFKSKTGIDVVELPRAAWFCNELFAIQEPLIVGDIAADPRFGDHSIAAALDGFRFYAGAPLRTREGHCIGTLCVMDQAPRPHFFLADIRQLVALADIVIDEFELRQVRYEIAHTRQQAEVASQAKAEFLATMSHEVRTPLNGVLGMTLALLQTNLNPTQYDYVKTILHSGDLLLAVLGDILDLSRIEAGQLTIENIDFDLVRGLDEAQVLWGALAAEKGLSFAIERQADLPERLRGDPARLLQILFNLVNNAIKFTERGEIVIRVGCRDLPGLGIELDVAVADTGIGIDLAVQPKLFNKFIQGDSSVTRRFGGSGLGLAICKQLVTLMGGSIGIESRPRHGSTVWFKVPCESARSPVTIPVPVCVSALQQTAHILLVEDDLVSQQVVLVTVRFSAYTVDVVGNGKEAIAALQRRHYDLVLMDVSMPEMDGLTATKEIRKLPGAISRVPIIALTAHAMPGDRDRFLGGGMNDYVSKPIDPTQLFAAIARSLPARQSADSLEHTRPEPTL